MLTKENTILAFTGGTLVREITVIVFVIFVTVKLGVVKTTRVEIIIVTAQASKVNESFLYSYTVLAHVRRP